MGECFGYLLLWWFLLSSFLFDLLFTIGWCAVLLIVEFRNWVEGGDLVVTPSFVAILPRSKL